jgi:hypothetical protein
MTSFSDEQLCEYMDGASGPELTAQIDRALESDLELHARLEAMRQNDNALRAAIDRELEREPFHPRWGADAPNVVPLSARRRSVAWWQMAAAVLLSLALGWSIAELRQPGETGEQIASAGLGSGGLVARADLDRALSKARNGVATQTAAGIVNVALSFRRGDGRYCRQFAVASPLQNASGVACRVGGVWQIAAWMTDTERGDAGYHTAAGPDDPRMNAILERLGVAQTLDRAGEDAAIRSGWKR